MHLSQTLDSLSANLVDDVVPSATEVSAPQWICNLLNVFPYAARGIRNFMSACPADNHDAHMDVDDDEKA